MREIPSSILRYVPFLLDGAVVTIRLTCVSIVIGTIIGLFAALGKMSRFRPLSTLAGSYVLVIRGTPLLVQLYIIYYGFSQVTGISLHATVAAYSGLSINAGAYIAEIIRAGIESIDKGQMEAARSLGMTYGQAMRRIILPQAYKRLLPPLGNEFVAMLKDSSLVSIIGMVELLRTAKQYASATFRHMEIYCFAALVYLVMTSVFSLFANYLEKRFGVYE